MSGEREGVFSIFLRRYEIHQVFIFTIEIFIFIQVVKDENAGTDSG